MTQPRNKAQRPGVTPIWGAPPAVRAFTLLEVLVSIAVIAVLLALALPALSHARARAREHRKLSDMRQLIVSLSLYAMGSDDRFPTALAPGGPETDPLTGQPLPSDLHPHSYLVRNALAWTEPLTKAGHELPPESDYPDNDPLNPVRRTNYPLTAAAFAGPGLFIENPRPADGLLRTQATARVRFPASKGLLLCIDPEVWAGIESQPTWVFAGLGDGSAARKTPRPGALPAPDSTVLGLPWPVLWTRDGLEGRDF